MDWYVHHKVWMELVFCGLGVAVAATLLKSSLSKIVAGVSRKPRRRPLGPVPNTGVLGAAARTESDRVYYAPLREPKAHEYHETPTASEVIATVRFAEPASRAGVRQGYCGRRVRWTLRISSVEKTGAAGFTHHVIMFEQATVIGTTHFFVNIGDFPLLQAARKDELFTVEGAIHDIQDNGLVGLTDVRAIQRAS